MGVAALAYNSSVLWNLGEAEEAQGRSDLSLELAEQFGGRRPAQAWGMRALLHLARLELIEFARWMERTRAHSVDHNVGYWRSLSTLLEGGCRHARGSSRRAARTSTARWRRTNAPARGWVSHASMCCKPICGCLR